MDREVAIFSRYLIRQEASARIKSLYQKKVAQVATIPPQEQRQLAFALAHPRLIGSLDSGLALLQPHAELRRRLYILFALFEATPDYANRFLPRQRSPFYLVIIGLVGIRAAAKAVFGILLLKVVVR